MHLASWIISEGQISLIPRVCYLGEGVLVLGLCVALRLCCVCNLIWRHDACCIEGVSVGCEFIVNPVLSLWVQPLLFHSYGTSSTSSVLSAREGDRMSEAPTSHIAIDKR